MPNSIAAMKTALRVLLAITDDANPDPDDIEELLKVAPEYSDLPFDELACEVIHRALEMRAAKPSVILFPR